MASDTEPDVAYDKEGDNDNEAMNEDNDDYARGVKFTLEKKTVHRSGEPFPEELLERFQEDLTKQKSFLPAAHFKPMANGNCYGQARPEMSLNLHSVEEDRKLIEIAARFYVRVKKRKACHYQHHHHPDWLGKEGDYGIDCSNFTAHLFNLCMGLRITSAIDKQMSMDLPKVTKLADLHPGDLVYFHAPPGSTVNHVGICVESKYPKDGEKHPTVVHSTIRRFNGINGPRRGWTHNQPPFTYFTHGFRFEDVRNKAMEDMGIIHHDGEYTVQQKVTGEYLDAFEDEKDDYQVCTRPAQHNDSQIWLFKPAGKGEFTIQQKINKRFLDAYEDGCHKFNAVTRLAQGDESQKWLLKDTGDGSYTMQQKVHMRFLDHEKAGKRVYTNTASTTGTQKWVIKAIGGPPGPPSKKAKVA